MKTLLAAAAIALAATSVNAELSLNAVDQAGFSKLSAEEQAAVVQMVAAKVKVSQDAPTAARVNEWVDVGKNIGSGLAGAAKEVGVAVNDFAKTPVGILTMLLIVFHMIGEAIIGVFVGLMVWLIGFGALRFMIDRIYPITIEYDPEKRTIFGNRVKLSEVRSRSWSSEFTFVVVVVASAILLGGAITIGMAVG